MNCANVVPSSSTGSASKRGGSVQRNGWNFTAGICSHVAPAKPCALRQGEERRVVEREEFVGIRREAQRRGERGRAGRDGLAVAEREDESEVRREHQRDERHQRRRDHEPSLGSLVASCGRDSIGTELHYSQRNRERRRGASLRARRTPGEN